MNFRNPFFFLFIGIAVGIILTYSLLHYANERTCPTQETRQAIQQNLSCPQQTCKNTTCPNLTCPAASCPDKECINDSSITPIFDDEFYAEMHKQINEANKSIHLILTEARYYPKTPKILANRIIEDLINASKRGVEVKIIIEEDPDNMEAYNILKQNAINVRFDGNKTNTHSKLAIIDQETTIIGSTDISYYSIEKNKETNALIRSENTAEQYENYFQNNWNTTIET